MTYPEWLDCLHEYARPTESGAQLNLRLTIYPDGRGNIQFVRDDGQGGEQQSVNQPEEAFATMKDLWTRAAEVREGSQASLTREERGRRMAEALGEIAARGGFAEIPDPIAWQREIREDRPLPGRES